ncbi:tetratricopeptide repeat protein [Streptomyces tropicalis]|uniref:Tetratricopeptide repeat protein n=1 Tax=Streptomyces tropicalis TaxID=3034234 RepID=A0ABT5ZZC7_9ACTN|nr:tetratricopeptide repeat protein [Streptomyces tropicalis]MDF3297744.1 tetratricopeptide repeat protein [Streptomyces tropicalis]
MDKRRETGRAAVPRRRGRVMHRALAALVAGGVAAGGTWLLLPSPERRPAAPAPAAGALAAVTAGAPVALPDLAALIGDRQRHLTAHPQDASAWAVLGAAFVERGRRTADGGDYRRADTALRTSLRLTPGRNAAALEGLAALADQRRDFRAARTYGEQALKLEPGRWTAYGPLIDACSGLGDRPAAQRALDRLLKLHRAPAVQAQAAKVFWDRGWREDAAAQLADAAAAAATPVEQAAYVEQAGRIAWERGDLEDALRHFETALRLDPGQWAALAGKGRALAALDRPREAVRAYRSALSRQPRPEYALELGELYESLGLRAPARTQYDLLRTRVGQDAAAGVDDELVLGRFEADHGQAEAAVWRLRAEWHRQPGAAVADALGWALHRDGQDTEALKFVTTATDKAGGGAVRSALYAYHRGMVERELDLTGPARRHLEEALRTNPYFSPLEAPRARKALSALGEPPDEEPPTDDAGPSAEDVPPSHQGASPPAQATPRPTRTAPGPTRTAPPPPPAAAPPAAAPPAPAAAPPAVPPGR